jgi:hypothetical protein
MSAKYDCLPSPFPDCWGACDNCGAECVPLWLDFPWASCEATALCASCYLVDSRAESEKGLA